MKAFDFSLRKTNIQTEIKNLITELRNDIVILGHHYQRPEIIKYCDFIGDSYGLAVEGMKQNTKYIIFCGVRFMAEGAAILATNQQQIILPEHHAGCPMADMMTGDKAEEILLRIKEDIGKIPAPVVYMNSYADSKMICGKYEGSVCTSSNAEKILKYYFSRNMPIFFFPDQHLGRNTANAMYLKPEEIALVKEDLSIEYVDKPEYVKIFLYDGYCHVHQDFTTHNIDEFRKEYPKGKVIVHPEVNKNVLQKADLFGSTEKIYNTVYNAPAGTIWGIGTEINFVQRLANACPDKIVVPIFSSLCYNMAKITEKKLLDTLQNIKECINNKASLQNEIIVSKEYSNLSKKALQKMIDIVEN